MSRSKSSGATRRARLRAQLTSFVGRRAELTEIRNALSTGRMVTLTGIGGVGKTRLALRAVDSAERMFPDGVWLVELAEVRERPLVVESVATALGVRGYGGRELEEALVEATFDSTTLLVLDNCEQVIDAVADLVQTLLLRCPDVHVLATSREPLQVGGETVIHVQPLSMTVTDRSPSLREIARSEAVKLFVERAASALPGFELTEANSVAVMQICERLDGLPLAIEFAAARIRALSPEQILERLNDRYALMTGGQRGVPPRQQTLRLSIGWSHELCTYAEQRLWGELSLFVGSFDLDDVEHLSTNDSEHHLLDTVTSLVDKSILVRNESHGRVRFRMLDTVRDYVQTTVRNSEYFPELQRRYCAWYVELARGAQTNWISASQLEWLDRLTWEQANLREALKLCFSVASNDALRITASLYPFWLARGQFAEGRRWLEQVLERPLDKSKALRAKALYALCVMVGQQGDEQALGVCVDRAQQRDYVPDSGSGQLFLAATEGAAALYSGDFVHSQTRFAPNRLFWSTSRYFNWKLCFSPVGPT